MLFLEDGKEGWPLPLFCPPPSLQDLKEQREGRSMIQTLVGQSKDQIVLLSLSFDQPINSTDQLN